MISVCASAHSVETGRYEQVCTRADFPRTGKVPQALPLSQLGVVNLVHLIEHCRPQNPCELHWNLDQALYSRNACLWWCLCVCVYALRIVSMDKIWRFTNTSTIINSVLADSLLFHICFSRFVLQAERVNCHHARGCSHRMLSLTPAISLCH